MRKPIYIIKDAVTQEELACEANYLVFQRKLSVYVGEGVAVYTLTETTIVIR